MSGQAASDLVVILVEPQLVENIGMVARAMANFGLSELRLVAPRDGWPRRGARQAASGAVHVLERAKLFPTAREAIADLTRVYATSARERAQMKRVLGPEEAMREARLAAAGGERVGVLFGRERTGLENEEVALADAVVTFPVARDFASVNLAQSVLLVGYEWMRQAEAGASAPFEGGLRSPPAPREMVVSFLEAIEAELDGLGFYPVEKRGIMVLNMRDMVLRMRPSEQDIRTLRGALRALATGRGFRKP